MMDEGVNWLLHRLLETFPYSKSKTQLCCNKMNYGNPGNMWQLAAWGADSALQLIFPYKLLLCSMPNWNLEQLAFRQLGSLSHGSAQTCSSQQFPGDVVCCSDGVKWACFCCNPVFLGDSHWSVEQLNSFITWRAPTFMSCDQSCSKGFASRVPSWQLPKDTATWVQGTGDQCLCC